MKRYAIEDLRRIPRTELEERGVGLMVTADGEVCVCLARSPSDEEVDAIRGWIRSHLPDARVSVGWDSDERAGNERVQHARAFSYGAAEPVPWSSNPRCAGCGEASRIFAGSSGIGLCTACIQIAGRALAVDKARCSLCVRPRGRRAKLGLVTLCEGCVNQMLDTIEHEDGVRRS